jgi:hypothetical protein
MRIALFGSPGVARPFNLPRGMVHHGTPGLVTGAGATFAAVVAGHHLDLSVVGVPGTLVIPFTGAEATRAAFENTINTVRLGFFQNGGFVAVDAAAGQIALRAFLSGSMAGITVLGSSSADVLASLGFVGGQVNVPASGWGLGPNHMYKAAVAFFGGVRPTGPAETILPANQHGVTLRTGPRPHLMVVDRQTATQGPAAVPFDSTRFAPLHQPG